jgi:gastric intrinsic factor
MVAVLLPLCFCIQTLVTLITAQNPEPRPTAHLVAADVSTHRALEWLLRQRLDDWGWGSDTPRAVLAAQLGNSSTWFGADNLESLLSGKQMELEIMLHLWRHHDSTMTPGRLSQYTLALNAICQDPRQFHGHDLIGSLQHHEVEQDFEFAFSSLAVCSSGTHVRKRQIRRLLDIAVAANDHNVDTLSMVLLALNCIVRDHRNRNLDHYVKKPSVQLAEEQHADGSFGNLHSTALAVQALEAANIELSSNGGSSGPIHWNQSNAINYLMSHQAPDGSFGDVFTTTEVILALGPRHLNSIRDLNCGGSNTAVTVTASIVKLRPPLTTTLPPTAVPSADSNLTAEGTISPGSPKEDDSVIVTYTLWVGTNVTENFTITVMARRNSSFYHVMQIAAEQDSRYVFDATEWPNGHYVHTIAGYKEEPSRYHYWLLYQMPDLPEPANPPGNNLITPVGVDGLTVEDGQHYLFWYKKL